jgi:cardiolipin synthase A/B
LARCVLSLGPDTAGGLLRELLAAARRRLDVAAYEVGPSYAAPLARAAARGVQVRLLLDAHAGANATAAAILAPTGVACRVLGGHPGVEGHWKLLLADGETLAVGSGNLIKRDAPPPGQPGTREWWATVTDASPVAAAARRAFDAAWSASAEPPRAWRRAAAAVPVAPPVGLPQPCVESLALAIPASQLHLCTGGAEVAALLGALLDGAHSRALATVPYVHTRVAAVRPLLDALLAAQAGGADVRLLLGTEPDPRDAAALAATPLHVRVMDPLRCTTGHAKGLVVDAAAVVGSANWSGTGLGGNHEAALLLDDLRAADWYAAALERDWAVARPLAPPKG